MQSRVSNDDELLSVLADVGEFGISQVQRLTHWGYNRAARKVEELVAASRIHQVPGKPYRYVLAQQPEPVGT